MFCKFFFDIGLTLSDSSLNSFSTSTCIALLEVTLLLKFYFTKLAISFLAAKFACANLSANFSAVNL